mgnify:CR=1 FL=1
MALKRVISIDVSKPAITNSPVVSVPVLSNTTWSEHSLIFKPLQFTGITFVFHWITDYLTSRWTTKLYKKKDWYGFFTVIGLDQFLHAAQLVITYTLIF